MSNDTYVFVKGGKFTSGLDHHNWNTALADWERKRTEIIEKVIVNDFWLGG